jgi:hypothetical protein
VTLINAKGNAVGIPEIEFAQVSVQMLFGAMLIDALHAALEDGIETFNRVRVDLAANVFVP